jgi:Mg-chelatase subunit ChlD
MVLRAKSINNHTPSTTTTGTNSLNEFAADFTMVENPAGLALRPRQRPHGDQAILEIHPLRESDAFIVSVHPPKVPQYGLQRASCDIVLVIDVSGSMAAAAPLPEATDDKDEEAAGLSVLDLVKHAARTILETLGPGDRLGIVTFSDDATVSLSSPTETV